MVVMNIILNFMIITKTPFRISFAGGGTDIKEFYQNEPGAVVSVTIDKYVYLSMHPLFNDKGYHLKYFNNELVKETDKIKHPIIREVFKRYNISGVDFNSTADIPSGTGLGSSSSFTVGLINICNFYNTHKHLSPEAIADYACKIEIDILKFPIGKQDQYATTYGGMNFIQFNPDNVVIERIGLSKEKRHQLENSLILFYLGGTRESSSVLTMQRERIVENVPALRKMAILANNLRDELNNDSIYNFGKILHDGWMYKKELASNITNGAIDYWYKTALENGAEGGKLLGAGNGGFLLLFAPKGKELLRASMRLYELPFKFEESGTKIIY